MHYDIKTCKALATQDILTYFTTRTLPYHLYADGFELFVFGASLTSVSLSKKSFLTDCKNRRALLSYFFFILATKIPADISIKAAK